MKNIYNDHNNRPAAKSLLRISAIIIMILVWILIDKGNIYGQSISQRGQTYKYLQERSAASQSPSMKEGDGSRDGDLPMGGEEENGFVVKPNPVEGELVFDFEFTVRTLVPVEVYDPLGKLVGTGQFEPGISLQKLDFSKYPTGMYIVRLHLGNKMETRRIIKK